MSAAMKTVLVLAAVGAVSAAVAPTAPGPGDSYNEGAACPIVYSIDSTGTWKNVTIELMTGSNTGMVHVADVTTGLDGTTGPGTFSWTCPQVTPNSAIYFYQFTNNGVGATWTTRFTIAGPDGETTKPTESTQPGGQAIPWGTGRLASGSAAGTGSTAGNSTTPASGSDNSTSASSAGPSGRSRASASATGAANASSTSSGNVSPVLSSGTGTSSSSAATSSNTSDSSTSGAGKMFQGLMAVAAGVAGVASLVL